jgi:hypothetical protein
MTTKLTEEEKQKLRAEALRRHIMRRRLINRKYDEILTSVSKEYISEWFSATVEYNKRIEEIEKM